MTERGVGPGTAPSAVFPGLLLVAADVVVGWLLYGAVGSPLGLVLWAVAVLVVGGMLVDGVRWIPRSAVRSLCTPVRK